MTNKRGQKPGIQRGNRQRFPYEPRVIGGKLLMPAELTIHRFVVETPVLKTVTDEIRAVVETVWPELISKLSTKALRRCSSSSAEWAVSRIYKTRAAVPAIVVPLDGRAIPMDGRSDRLQGTLTETLGIALADLRQHDDALGQRRPNGVVAARSGAERGQRHLKGNTHLTDRFAVKVVTVQVRSDGHGSRKVAPD
jgi:hypothetical protein